MNRNLIRCLIFCSIFLSINCSGQSRKPVGGGCEGCEAIFEFGEKTLTNVDTLPEFDNSEPKLKLTGTVFQQDGKTPAKDVILYIYHTDPTGIYPKKGNETGWAKRHGYLRGWVKTDQSGHYAFYTFRPAAYPDRSDPEHIHLTVKESDKNEYYLDDFVFGNDPILTDKKRKLLSNRGGSGIGNPQPESGMLTFRRDIILGLNIPGYE
ncbi:intradiol ring-cleavage dioxygenase [Algoriphagus sp. A40]|uniref:dioxygenase family protein n=1 Tax=Algoriphagus sp. A40 TaxID=1945863 RepID=UPI000984607D|nr:intradiol ring-cleavage dioxygenase [Algoriphagus sp. A40]OOG70665.1 intradiol ring-cleavage dioxygenase [Algoriphagus sp. A40]